MNTYLLVYLGSAFLALMCVPLAIRIAKALGICDDPNVRKVHATAIPRIGGLAILVGVMGAMIPVLLLNSSLGKGISNVQPKMIALLAGGAFMFGVGLVDDMRHLRATTKLLCQLCAALVVCAVGIRINTIHVPNWFTINFGWFSWPITILWIVGVTNAINLIDGLDGLAAGISAITCAVVAVFALYTGQKMVAVLMLSLLGSLSGFLFFNFNPAKVFMGDCGSLFLGFVLATASVFCAVKSATLLGIALPALAMGIPIFDTLLCMVRRVLERRSIFSPDRGHFHHRLLDMGLHHRHVVMLIYLATMIIAGMGMFMMAARNLGVVAIFAGELLLLLLLFRLVGAVRWREMLASLHRNRSIAQEVQEHRRDFDNAQLLLRQARTFEQWWWAIEKAAEQMDLVSVTLPLQGRDGTLRTMRWRRGGSVDQGHNVIDLTLPVHQRRADDPLRLELVVWVNGSLESAGRRAALFSRLIDEHDLTGLPLEPIDTNRQWVFREAQLPELPPEENVFVRTRQAMVRQSTYTL